MCADTVAIDTDSAISIFSITWQSLNDGPGKRLVLFLQGCPLDCKWCHSPHSTPQESPLLFFDSLCAGCTRCGEICPNGVHTFKDGSHQVNRAHCTKCGACVEGCPQSSASRHTGALVLPTQHTTTYTLFETIRPQLELLKKVGGITISGGEPLLQADAAAALANRCKQAGINTALETSGIIDVSKLQKVSPYIDTWMIGLRLTTGHHKGISPSLEHKTRQTLSYLTSSTRSKIIVRIPIIPGYTTTPPYLQAVRRIVSDFSLTNIELLPQNPEGDHYYRATGIRPLVGYSKQLADESYQKVAHFFSQAH